jgi:hypothetical protein
MSWLSSYPGILAVIVAKFGGVAVIGGATGALLSKFFSDRMIANHKSQLDKALEDHKSNLGQETERLKSLLNQDADSFRLQLKKRELLFNKELDTVSIYMKLRRQILPSYSHPEMDWNDACTEAVCSFKAHADRLDLFIAEHGAVLPPAVRIDLEKCSSMARVHQFDSSIMEGDASAPALNAADEFLTTLGQIEERLISKVRSWEK